MWPNDFLIQALYDDLPASQQLYSRNGYIKSNRHLGKIVHQSHNSLGQQQHQLAQHQPIQQPMYIATNPNGLASAVHNVSLADANEALVGNTEDEASSGESIDGTPPDTPSMRSRLFGATVTHSSNKKYPKMPLLPHRHKSQIYNPAPSQQPQLQAIVTHNANQPITLQGDLSPTPQQQSQLLPQNNNLVTSTVLISSKPSGIVTSTIQGFGISGPANTPVIYQQYGSAPPHHIQQSIQQPQINTTYHYHTQPIPMSNRAAILPTPNTTTPAAHTNTYRVPPQYLPPNGDVLYSYQAPIAYMPSPALPRPSSHPSHPTVTVIQQSALNAVPMKHSTSLAAYPTIGEAKVLSCFNCGAHSHTGRDCQESSIEDVTRGTVYKLDYTAPPSIDTKSELDNGLDALPPVTNK